MSLSAAMNTIVSFEVFFSKSNDKTFKFSPKLEKCYNRNVNVRTLDSRSVSRKICILKEPCCQ